MKVVLLERVEKLGAIGDVVTVKDGFARNYLLPRSKALRANSANMRVFEPSAGRSRPATPRTAPPPSGWLTELDGRDYLIIRQAGESGQLYGSVTARDVAEAVQAEGGKIERSQVVLDTPIKTLGMHDIRSACTPR
jgi:large subunit ribosomal protein L9